MHELDKAVADVDIKCQSLALTALRDSERAIKQREEWIAKRTAEREELEVLRRSVYEAYDKRDEVVLDQLTKDIGKFSKYPYKRYSKPNRDVDGDREEAVKENQMDNSEEHRT